MQIDDRLLDAVAACLCWAEWPRHASRNDAPWSYWRTLPDAGKARYRADAGRIASLMVSDREYALVPVRATAAMRDAAIDAGRGLRSASGAAHVWEEMVATARRDLGWRTGKACSTANGSGAPQMGKSK